MTTSGERPAGDRDLWLRYRSSVVEPGGSCPDRLSLAAYIDESMVREEVDEIESHLAVCRRCLDHVVALRSGPLEEAVPERMRVAARRVVSAPPPLPSPGTWGRRLALAASLTGAVLLASWVGYRAGSETASLEQRLETAVRRELTFGLAPFVETSPEEALVRRRRPGGAS